jgi:hypothetical protein
MRYRTARITLLIAIAIAMLLSRSTDRAQGPTLPGALNQRRYCDQFNGASVAAKINNCIAALPTTGGIADATGFTGSQTLAAVTVPKFITLLLGNTQFTVTSTLVSNEDSAIIGQGGASSSGVAGTVLKAGNSLNAPILQAHAAAANEWWHGGRIEHIQFEGNSANQASGNCVELLAPGEVARASDLWIDDCKQDGLYIGAHGAATPAGSHAFYNISVFNNLRYGVQLDGVGTAISFVNLSGDGNGSLFACHLCQQSSVVSLLGVKAERGTGGMDPLIRLSATNGIPEILIQGLSFDSSAAITDLVKIVNEGDGSRVNLQILSSWANASFVTNVLEDTIGSLTVPLSRFNAGHITNFNHDNNAQSFYRTQGGGLYGYGFALRWLSSFASITDNLQGRTDDVFAVKAGPAGLALLSDQIYVDPTGGHGSFVGIGTQSPSEHLHIAGSGNQNFLIDTSSNNPVEISLRSENTNTKRWDIRKDGSTSGLSTGHEIDYLWNGTTVGFLDTNGLFRAYGGLATYTLTSSADPVCWNYVSYTLAGCTSLRSTKTDFAQMLDATRTLMGLRPQQFMTIADHRKRMGFVAEEVASVNPRLSSYDGKGKLIGVDYNAITALDTKVIQEQETRIRRLEQQLAALSAQLKKSQRRVRWRKS